MNKLAVVVLAAGEGTRMKSARPKVLHELSGKPLARWVLSAVQAIGPEKVFLVVGHGADRVREELANERVVFVHQKQQRGSGHALRQAEKSLKTFGGDVIVLCGDTPLIQGATLRALLKFHRKEGNAATILSACVKNPFGYGRIIRAPSGRVQGIVEEKDATAEEKAVQEINSGIYCFKSPLLWKTLGKVTNKNSKKEYYLTDVIAILNGREEKVGAYSEVTPEEILGVNTRLDLAGLAEILRRRILSRLMLDGVTIIDPANTYVSPEARIGADTTIHPGTIIEGKSVIGQESSVGPYTLVKDSTIGRNADVKYSVVCGSSLGDNVRIGPFSHLRPGSRVKEKARVGNFSEVKNSIVGIGSKVNHLSYVGDSLLGRDVNVGAGTITCNFDGVRKNKTIIEDRVFVGSNVNLVAPVRVGRDVILGAGSTITEDVPAGTLAIARARQVHKPRKK